MEDISAMTVTESAEKLKSEPFLLNVLKKWTCATVLIRTFSQNRACRQTSYDRKESYADIAVRDSHCSLFQISFDSQEH